MTINRYAGTCELCLSHVPARGGSLHRSGGGKWTVRHLACAEAGEAAVIHVRTSDWSGIQNSRGRCEDAPCCGCCTF